ncbi:MAG: phage tail protein [Cyanobacteriota bacterium]|nr:phage tail protein [Cyanobacteriota bacterium]
MVQSRSSPINIELTPMQIPEAVPRAGLQSQESESLDKLNSGLLLNPGQASEMIVRIQNKLERSLRLNLKVEGDFPTQWCQIGTEGNEISPGEKMDAVLRFQIPKSFFEDQQAIIPTQKDRLKLDFRSFVTLHLNPDTDREEIHHSKEFGLHIRPWTKYLEFLPVLYREVDFIGRFMKIFEKAYQPAIDSFNTMWANLDPLTAPQALLPFLAHWVAWEFDSTWDTKQQRRLMRRAVELYRWRGTRKGLRLYLHLYTGLPLDEDIPNENDKHISITEPFGDSFILGEAQLGSAILAGGQAFHFVVRLRPQEPDSINESLMRRIIEQEKPAFCSYELFIE